jgi:hypothetical protein
MRFLSRHALYVFDGRFVFATRLIDVGAGECVRHTDLLEQRTTAR